MGVVILRHAHIRVRINHSKVFAFNIHITYLSTSDWHRVINNYCVEYILLCNVLTD